MYQIFQICQYFCIAYLDVCGGDVVWGGVEPLDRVHHAGVVHLAEKCYLMQKNISITFHHICCKLQLFLNAYWLSSKKIINTNLIPHSSSDVLHLTIYYWQPCTGLG